MQTGVATAEARPDPAGPGFKLTRFACLSALILLTGCAVGGNSDQASTGSIGAPAQTAADAIPGQQRSAKVALLLPLSAAGQTAAIAKSMKQAGEMALFDRDDSGFELVVLDDKGTAEGARTAAEQAVKDGAELILGPLFSPSVVSAADVARPGNIPIVAFSNDRQVAKPGVFLISHLIEAEVERVVSYAAAQGKRRIAAFVPDDAFGRAAEAAFKSAVQTSGNTVAAIERYPLAANGILEPARRLGDALRELEAGGQPADALFLPGGQEQLSQLAPILTYAAIDTSNLKVLGTGGMDHPGIGREKLFAGAWFAGPDPRGWQDFSARFSKTFGTAPPRIAALAYDAVTLAASLSKEPAGARFTPATITRPSGFNAVDGALKLGANGLPMRGLAVLEVRDFGSSVIDPAQVGTASAQVSSNAGRLN